MSLVSIGEFARLSRPSPKVLRLYDELGLLLRDRRARPAAHRRGCRPLVERPHRVLRAPHVPDQHLIVNTVEPDSSTARVLPILAS
ncbi:hypothetical protein [Streptomyces silvisoli]|uniref:MerR family DNA-binding transcriptional regulator n=1 Tax=Streptomyces silvisoli TaxID=3034235 RepID=A0ABT5ZKC3_9ACTN|nr:hypothetical protein [Streptomyces silvisoli]MDF3290141.1 hypothetical protein [Streptomyces silvisoli]